VLSFSVTSWAIVSQKAVLEVYQTLPIPRLRPSLVCSTADWGSTVEFKQNNVDGIRWEMGSSHLERMDSFFFISSLKKNVDKT
jgi:hypothetical protein